MRKHDLKINELLRGNLNRESDRFHVHHVANKELINELLDIVSSIELDEETKERINTYIAKNNTYSFLERKRGSISTSILIETYYPFFKKI